MHETEIRGGGNSAASANPGQPMAFALYSEEPHVDCRGAGFDLEPLTKPVSRLTQVLLGVLKESNFTLS